MIYNVTILQAAHTWLLADLIKQSMESEGNMIYICIC